MAQSAARFSAVVLVISLSLTAEAAPTKPASLFPEDDRLKLAVTVRAGHIYLGELLEQLSSATGVSLTVDDRKGPLSGIQLSVFVKDQPLRHLMSGLTGLFSHQANLWEWKVAKGEEKGYVLAPQLPPQAAAAAARQAIETQWSADVRAFHEIVRTPDQERAAQISRRPDLFPDQGVDWDLANLLGELSAQELDALLKGRPVTMDRSRLTRRGQEAYTRHLAGNPRGKRTVLAVPGVHHKPLATDTSPEILLYVTWTPDHIGPVLWCRAGGAAQNVMGGAWWDAQWLGKAGRGWRSIPDAQVQEFLRKRASGDTAAGQRGLPATLPEWMQRAATRQGMNVLVDPVFPQYRSNYQTWYGQTPQQTAFAVVFYDYNASASGDIQLLRHESASAHPRGHLIAWPRVKALRQAADRNQGYLSFQDLLSLAALSPDQLSGLAEEFPDANPETLEVWRPILQFYLNLSPSAQARLMSPAGLPYQEAGLVARRGLEAEPDPASMRGLPVLLQHARTAVLALRPETAGEQRRLVWDIQVPGATGFKTVFTQQPRQPLSADGAEKKPAKTRERQPRQRGSDP